MSKKKKQIAEEDIVVKLKPIMGIRPGVYLTIIYALVILVLLFMLLVLPGLKNPGTEIKFVTNPNRALVFVDGVYRGTTPCTVFVKKGEHELVLEKKYFTKIEFKKDVKGRLLFSLPFPRKVTVDKSLKLLDPEEFLNKRYKEIGGYALIRDFFEGYQYPPLIKRTVTEFSAGVSGKEQDLYEFLYNMRLQFGNKAVVKDLSEAIKTLLPEYRNLNSDYEVIRNFYTDKGFSTENLVFAYLNAFKEKERESVIKNDKAVSTDYHSSLSKIPAAEMKVSQAGGKSVRVFGMDFIYIPSGVYTAGVSGSTDSGMLNTDRVFADFPHRESVEDFYMMQGEVTAGDYRKFIDENPGWKKESIEELKSKGYVTDDYLFNFDSLKNSIPVSYVSWYAAEAYCKWLTSKLPEPFRGRYEVKLPAEEQWEFAARLNYLENTKRVFKDRTVKGPEAERFDRRGAVGLYDILGNLWEWNSNCYLPSDTIFGGYGIGSSGYSGNEKAVRGGSWANSRDGIDVTTRGSQEPSWCTPFLGFRVVLVKKGN